MKMAMSDNLDWLESNRFTPDTSVPEWQPNRWMALYWVGVAGMAVCWLVNEWMFGFFLFFTVGWANGWPLGLMYRNGVLNSRYVASTRHRDDGDISMRLGAATTAHVRPITC